MKKFIKNSIIWIWILVLGLGFFSWYSTIDVFAQDCPTQELKDQSQSFCIANGWTFTPDWDCGSCQWTTPASAWQWLIDLAAILDVVINVLYLILWPVLAITWMALDNSLIYAEAFRMTDMLFKFRRMMVNISFILLALSILWELASLLRSWKDIKSVLKGSLLNRILAWILIPASRWILSAIIDLSTLLIYQVWWIPLSLIETDDKLDKYILGQAVSMNLSDRQSDSNDDAWWYRFSFTFSCGDNIYLPCKFENNRLTTEDRKTFINQSKEKYKQEGKEQAIDNWSKFCAISPTQLLYIENGLDLSAWTNTKNPLVADSRKKWSEEMVNAKCQTISTLVDSSKSMVWPLYSIYWWLLNFNSLNVTTSARSTEAEVMLFLMKWIVWVLLIFPLIALCFMSISRVAILRVTIVFSPLIIIYYFLNKNSKLIKWVGDGTSFEAFWKFLVFKPDLEWLIQLIFQPVIVVLALGISVVFLSATNSMLWNEANEKWLLDAIWIELDTSNNQQTYKIHNNNEHTIDISLKNFNGVYATDIFFDYFSRIIANIFGILIMRWLMKAALWSSKMTKAIWDKVMQFGQDYLATRPIFGDLSRRWWFDDNYGAIPNFTKKLTDKLTDDTTEWAARDFTGYLTKRMLDSDAYNKHQKDFVAPDNNLSTPESWIKAAEIIAKKWNSIFKSEWWTNDSYHYLNNNDLKNRSSVSSKAWWSWSSGIHDLMWNKDFRNNLLQSKDWVDFIAQAVKSINNPQAIRNVVGVNSSNQKTFRNNVESFVKELRNNSNEAGEITYNQIVWDRRIIAKTSASIEKVNNEEKTNYTLNTISTLPKDIQKRTQEDADKANGLLDEKGLKDICSTALDKNKEWVYFDNGKIVIISKETAEANTKASSANNTQWDQTSNKKG